MYPFTSSNEQRTLASSHSSADGGVHCAVSSKLQMEKNPITKESKILFILFLFDLYIKLNYIRAPEKPNKSTLINNNLQIKLQEYIKIKNTTHMFQQTY